MSDMMDTLLISAIGIVASVGITFAMNKFGISPRLKEIQQFTNSVNKEYFDALRKKDTKRLDELDPKMKESQKLSLETIVLQMKSMAIFLPIFIGVPYILPMLFPTFTITLPFQIPIPFRQPDLLALTWRDTFGAYGWFYLSFIFIGGLTQVLIGQYKQMKAKGKKDGQNPANGGKPANGRK